MKRLLYVITIIIFLVTAQSQIFSGTPVRVKDIAHILEARDNQLMGFGLVIGLNATGDSMRTGFTKQALTNLLRKMGIPPESESFNSRNCAAVMVTCDLPPFVKSGQRISVTVSSLGDARSLKGGTLIQTPLTAADGSVYAVAQGAVTVGGISAEVYDTKYIKNQNTVGRIPQGALVEKEVSVTVKDADYLTLVLNNPDFTTAARLAKTIRNKRLAQARAVDATTVKISLAKVNLNNIVDFISKIEYLTVIPDTVAKVVINGRTGTIVIGERVKISPVAVSQGNITVKISASGGESGSQIKVTENKAKLVTIAPKPTLSNLVKALNKIGTTPRDLISILQAIKAAGALSAEIEVI